MGTKRNWVHRNKMKKAIEKFKKNKVVMEDLDKHITSSLIFMGAYNSGWKDAVKWMKKKEKDLIIKRGI